MPQLKVLICGGGCAGPAVAFWLAHAGHEVALVERFPALRATGAQIDLRAQGIQAVKRMGLMDAIGNCLVDEPGTSLVSESGRVFATVMANKSGKGSQTMTSEFEIMRGDLVRVLHDATKDKVQYRFGLTVEKFEQDDKQVVAYFSDGQSESFDLLIGADGQGSRVRRAILPPNTPDPLRKLGIYLGYWFVPRLQSDTNIQHSYTTSGGRMIMRRCHNQTDTQAYFCLNDPYHDYSSIPKASLDEQKAFWRNKFHDAGWQSGRFLDAMETTDNFYCQEVVQVKSPIWHKGRVVLLGDAGYCPSPFTGMGTTASFVGAYVLAGELCRHSDDLPQALSNYETILRPFVDVIQHLSIGKLRLGMPQTRLGVWTLRSVAAVMCFFRIPELLARFSPAEKGGWVLPEYPELTTDGDS